MYPEKKILLLIPILDLFLFLFLEKNALSNCIKLLKYFTAA